MKFFEKFLRHEVNVSDFLDAVNAWHKDPKGGEDISEYLGMTDEQYGIFLTKPKEAEKLRSKKVKQTGSFLEKIQSLK